jgi:hypothetical protein
MRQAGVMPSKSITIVNAAEAIDSCRFAAAPFFHASPALQSNSPHEPARKDASHSGDSEEG